MGKTFPPISSFLSGGGDGDGIHRGEISWGITAGGGRLHDIQGLDDLIGWGKKGNSKGACSTSRFRFVCMPPVFYDDKLITATGTIHGGRSREMQEIRGVMGQLLRQATNPSRQYGLYTLPLCRRAMGQKCKYWGRAEAMRKLYKDTPGMALCGDEDIRGADLRRYVIIGALGFLSVLARGAGSNYVLWDAFVPVRPSAPGETERICHQRARNKTSWAEMAFSAVSGRFEWAALYRGISSLHSGGGQRAGNS